MNRKQHHNSSKGVKLSKRSMKIFPIFEVQAQVYFKFFITYCRLDKLNWASDLLLCMELKISNIFHFL